MEKTKVLVVEDDRTTANILKMRLESLGYEVPAVVSFGEDVVRNAEEHKPDIVLMDIHLAGKIDGIEAADRLRTKLDIPVVYLTIHADDETIQRAKVTEPFGYIVKDSSLRELKANITIALYKHGMDKELREHTDIVERLNKQLTQGVLRMDELRKENERLKNKIEEMKKQGG